MTFPQLAATAIVLAMTLAFLWGRLRYDLVAGLALAAAVVVGVVPARDAFKGFSDDIVVIIASALVISAAISRTGVLDGVVKWLTRRVHSIQMLLISLVSVVTVSSAIIKNIGSLAMAMPVAFQVARRKNVSPSLILMPMAFGSLLGGMVTLVGTSPNVIVSRVRQEMTGQPFAMFDFAPVGLILAIVGIIYLALAYRLIPQDRHGPASMSAALEIGSYTTEAIVAPNSPVAGKTIADLRSAEDGSVKITAIVRASGRSVAPLPDAALAAGDRLILSGESAALERFIGGHGLTLESAKRPIQPSEPRDDILVVEAVIAAHSPLIGLSAGDAALHLAHDVNLLALSRRGARMTQRLRDIAIVEGDVVVLRGAASQMPERLKQFGALPLADRSILLGSQRKGVLGLAILGLTVLALAGGFVPVAAGFAGAALAMVALRVLPLRDTYNAIEWPLIFMLAAIIPVSDSLQTTGVSSIISRVLSDAAMGLPVWSAVAMIMVAAMAVTPFLNNAATVLIMAPIASAFATTLGHRPEPFLMAVAVGAACDFLTPVGHQCNTLVMGPGGYRFGDYARLGAPLSLIVVLVGTMAILAFWPSR